MRKSALVVLLTGLVLLVLGPLAVAESAASQREQDKTLQNDAAQLASGFTAQFERARSLNLLVAQNPLVHHTSSEVLSPEVNAEANRALAGLLSLYPGAIVEACLIDDKGRELARVAEGRAAPISALSKDKSKNNFFKETLALPPGEVYQAAPYVSSDTHGWVVSNSTAAELPNGDRVIVHFEVTLASFAQQLFTGTADRRAAVVDLEAGRTILADDGLLPYFAMDFPTFKQAEAVRSVDVGPTTVTAGDRRLTVAPIATSPANANRWAVVQWSNQRAGLLPEWAGLTATGGAGALLVLFFFLVRRQHGALQMAARLDHLTGMGNRKVLEEALEEAVAASRNGERTGVLVLDLDGFKQVNDTLGHDKGDLVLQEIAQRLHANTFEYDTAARMGGDEFAVVLRRLHSQEDATAVAQRLRDALVRPIDVEGVARFIGVSVGAALCPAHGRTSADLLRAADAAMYRAKRTRQGVCLYEAGTAEGADESGLAAELLVAIETDEIRLVFQPEHSLDTGRIVTVEALARWDRSEGNSVPPSEFVPLAEETGLIKQLTELTLRKALDEVAVWRDAGIDVPVSVNLSGRLVVDRSLPGIVIRMLQERDLDGSSLVLEITETAAITDVATARQVLQAVRSHGVRIELDDFGSGYASARTLRDIPLDGIKVDRDLVNDVSVLGRNMLASTIDMGKALQLYVVAEGVEDEAGLEAMRSLGADVAQGFHLARPMEASAVRALLAEAPVGLANSPA